MTANERAVKALLNHFTARAQLIVGYKVAARDAMDRFASVAFGAFGG